MVAVMPDDALDAEKIGLLGQWAEGLQHDGRAELAAAGRAILMLIEEVERLHVHLWDQHLNAPDANPDAVAPSGAEGEVADIQPELEQSLRNRLRARLKGASADA